MGHQPRCLTVRRMGNRRDCGRAGIEGEGEPQVLLLQEPEANREPDVLRT